MRHVDYGWFLERIIKDGIEAAKRDYSSPSATTSAKLTGSIDGFNACRGKKLSELLILRDAAARRVLTNLTECGGLQRHWYLTCFAAEVEWCCNVVGAGFGFAELGMEPASLEHLELARDATARGLVKAAEILWGGGDHAA